jgi:hypothetical protein
LVGVFFFHLAYFARNPERDQSQSTAMFCLFSFREEFVSRALSLFVTLLFDLLVDSPLVAKRIDNLSVTSSGQYPTAPENRAR